MRKKSIKKSICVSIFNHLAYSMLNKMLNVKTEAVKKIIQLMGMQPYERSDKVPEGKSSHSLFLGGVYRGKISCLIDFS